MGIISSVVGGVITLASTWLKGKVEKSKAKAEAEVEVIKSRAKADINWERLMAESSMNSWKDEFWTIVWASPLIMCFIPDLAPYAKEGFATLEKSVPDWYLYILSVVVAAAFGVKKVIGAIKSVRK